MPKVDNIETTTKLFLDDEYEPTITQDNVVILRVNFLDHDQTELFFVITKDLHVQTLSQDSLMEPNKIKYILSAQIGPLSRVLGGVHIHELQLDEVHRLATLDNDNSKMRTLLIIVGFILFIIYAIAVYKCVKQTRKKKRTKRRREKEQKYGPSYGACTEKLLTDYERTNGKPKLTSIPSRESISSVGRRLAKTSDARTPTLKTPTYDDDRPSLDARSFNRMFACDPSQLPAEYHRQLAEQDDDSVNILMPSPPSSARSMVPTKEEPTMPSVILVSSGTPDFIAAPTVPKSEMLVDSPEPFTNQQEASNAAAAASLLETNVGFNPYERPLSRRGSRNSTPEEGEEYAEEDREDTPPPLGDEASIVEKLENLPKNEPPVARSHTAHKFGHWSSDSESENEVYQRLSEVSEGEEGAEENANTTTKRKKRKIQKNASSDLESVTSDEEDKGIDEEEALERHQYERLQESPTHTKPLPDMSLELDSALQYQ
jgi:large-conductance mechanosensitive channel